MSSPHYDVMLVSISMTRRPRVVDTFYDCGSGNIIVVTTSDEQKFVCYSLRCRHQNAFSNHRDREQDQKRQTLTSGSWLRVVPIHQWLDRIIWGSWVRQSPPRWTGSINWVNANRVRLWLTSSHPCTKIYLYEEPGYRLNFYRSEKFSHFMRQRHTRGWGGDGGEHRWW